MRKITDGERIMRTTFSAMMVGQCAREGYAVEVETVEHELQEIIYIRATSKKNPQESYSLLVASSYEDGLISLQRDEARQLAAEYSAAGPTQYGVVLVADDELEYFSLVWYDQDGNEHEVSYDEDFVIGSFPAQANMLEVLCPFDDDDTNLADYINAAACLPDSWLDSLIVRALVSFVGNNDTAEEMEIGSVSQDDICYLIPALSKMTGLSEEYLYGVLITPFNVYWADIPAKELRVDVTAIDHKQAHGLASESKVNTMNLF